VTVAARNRYLEQSEWLSPINIDNSGGTNVSKALTDWLAATGRPGDLFKLRQGFYWVPQGVGIGKAMTLDLNGSLLFTGLTLGPEDPNLAQSQIDYPPVFIHWDEDTLFLDRRSIISVAASDVNVRSSLAGARLIGAARKVLYKLSQTNMPSGCEYNSTFQGQHGIRVGYESSPNVFATIANIDLDLTNISIEFCSGDGIYLIRNTDGVEIHGQQAGPDVVNANTVMHLGHPWLGGVGGLPDEIDVGGGGGGTYDLWVPGGIAYPGIHHTARQGIATDFPNANLTIRDLSIWRGGRTAIDLELATGFEYDGVTIQRVEFGHWNLGHISNPHHGAAHDVLIEDCICYQQMNIHVAIDEAEPLRRQNWTIRGNRYRFRKNNGGGPTGGAAVRVTAIDGLTIANNFGWVEISGQGIDLGDSTSVTTSPSEDTQFVPTATVTGCPAFAGVATATGRAWTPTIQR
jgi:hypothetical protein